MWRVWRPGARRGRIVGGGAALVAIATLGLGGVASYQSSGSPGSSVRVFGSDRYATAAAVSAATFPHGASLVYLATGNDYSDALAAAAAAGGRAPVLLVNPGYLPAPTASELNRLDPSWIVIVGGVNAISTTTYATVHALLPNATLTRVFGLRRYDTAAALSRMTFSSAPIVYLATGLNYPDALAAAGAAAGRGPVLLVAATYLPTATATELQRLAPGTVHVVGGLSAVDAAVFSAVRSALPSATVDRIAGPDRFSTAAALAEVAFPYGASVAYVATGLDFPDALAAAVASGGGGPVLLVASDPYAGPAEAELTRLHAQQLVVVGGVFAVADTLVSELQHDLSQGAPPVSPKASAVVATAQAQLGKPYEWAGAGPDSFDCSGLVMYAWAAAGVTLPHNAEDQAMAVAPVAIADLQPGDIVFYGTPGNVYHDAIYIGNGQMIEAAHTGVPVRISDINRPDLLIGGRPRT
jgi:putative cell wall-binding protein